MNFTHFPLKLTFRRRSTTCRYFPSGVASLFTPIQDFHGIYNLSGDALRKPTITIPGRAPGRRWTLFCLSTSRNRPFGSTETLYMKGFRPCGRTVLKKPVTSSPSKSV
jgi:hypothetical protein